MRFKIDENLPIEAAQLLGQAGHEAKTVHEEDLVGRPDNRVAAACQREDRALVTIDLDFADIRAYPPQDYAGLMVLRPRLQVKHHILDWFVRRCRCWTWSCSAVGCGLCRKAACAFGSSH